jgi:hypothetical protein
VNAPCRYCGKRSEDGSGVCAACERRYEKDARLNFRAKRGCPRKMAEKFGVHQRWTPRGCLREARSMKQQTIDYVLKLDARAVFCRTDNEAVVTNVSRLDRKTLIAVVAHAAAKLNKPFANCQYSVQRPYFVSVR